jgi:hypothetical protein
MTIIEMLKKNEKPFGLMCSLMQDKAKEIGKKEFEYFSDTRSWVNNVSNTWYNGNVYRLRPDYEEEPEIVECEVFVEDSILRYTHDEDKHAALAWAPNRPDFIGFNLCDRIWGRLYRRKDNGDTSICIYADQLDKYDVVDMAEAKVLFRSKK